MKIVIERITMERLARYDGRQVAEIDIGITSVSGRAIGSRAEIVEAANADERSHGDGDGPLVHLARVIEESGPAVVFFENVPEWFGDGHFREFGERLCELGFDIAPPLFISSGQLGGSHERERVFCMGHQHGARWAPPWVRSAEHDAAQPEARERAVANGQHGAGGPRVQGQQGRTGIGRDRLADRRGAVADSRYQHLQLQQRSQGDESQGGEPQLANGERDGRSGHGRREGAGAEPHAQDGVHDVANGERERSQGGRAAAGTDRRRDALEGHHALSPPGRPTWDDELAHVVGRDRTTLGDVRRRCAGTAGALRQWAELVVRGLDPTLMPAVVAGVSVVADGDATPPLPHSDLLRIGGNGVDALVVGFAFHTLLTDLMERTKA